MVPLKRGNRQWGPGDAPESILLAIRAMVEGIGMQREAQLKRLNRNSVLSKGMSIMDILSAGGVQRVVTLPLNRVHFWLTTISAGQNP